MTVSKTTFDYTRLRQLERAIAALRRLMSLHVSVLLHRRPHWEEMPGKLISGKARLAALVAERDQLNGHRRRHETEARYAAWDRARRTSA